ncbi:MAG: hypothetical protein LCH63_21265 [Candidatus Melainabacteria bacterium]|jgi:hypothetical protein|nr:hypothetical protein [Candidatus Melainabacteria bacterium]
MDNKPCIKASEFDLMSRLSLSIPTGKVCVKTQGGDEPSLLVQLTSNEYRILVPETFQGHKVDVQLVGAVPVYKKSDFMCGGPED